MNEDVAQAILIEITKLTIWVSFFMYVTWKDIILHSTFHEIMNRYVQAMFVTIRPSLFCQNMLAKCNRMYKCCSLIPFSEVYDTF